MIGKMARLPGVRNATKRKLLNTTNIIYYHYFGEPQCYSDDYADCSLEKFDSDLRLIRKYFDFVPIFTVLDNHLARRELERPQIALTFDDAFDMFRNGVVDVLDHHGIKATTFLITACVGNKDLMWINKLNAIASLRPQICNFQYNALMEKTGLPPTGPGAIKDAAIRIWPMPQKEEFVNELWQTCDMPPLEEFLDEYRPYFTWRGIEEWLKRGHSVGLHTRTHPVCGRIDENLADQEIRAPGRMLRERFGLPYLALAYPFGSRLDSELEKKLYRERDFDFAFGIKGFSPKGIEPHQMERVNGEDQIEFTLFGKALLNPSPRQNA